MKVHSSLMGVGGWYECLAASWLAALSSQQVPKSKTSRRRAALSKLLYVFLFAFIYFLIIQCYFHDSVQLIYIISFKTNITTFVHILELHKVPITNSITFCEIVQTMRKMCELRSDKCSPVPSEKIAPSSAMKAGENYITFGALKIKVKHIFIRNNRRCR